MEPKVKVDRSRFAGVLGSKLKREVRKQPWLTYQELSDSLKPYCEEGTEPTKREAVRRYLLKNWDYQCRIEKNRLFLKLIRKNELISRKNILKKMLNFGAKCCGVTKR